MPNAIWLPLLAALACCAAAPARAVDAGDSATYLVINGSGQTTTKALRVQFHKGEWIIMDRTTVGDWVHVRCDLDCKLLPSSEADMKLFLAPGLLENNSVDCINSKAIAFCGYRSKANPDTGRHYLFAVINQRPLQYVRLARVMSDGKVVQ